MGGLWGDRVANAQGFVTAVPVWGGVGLGTGAAGSSGDLVKGQGQVMGAVGVRRQRPRRRWEAEGSPMSAPHHARASQEFSSQISESGSGTRAVMSRSCSIEAAWLLQLHGPSTFVPAWDREGHEPGPLLMVEPQG